MHMFTVYGVLTLPIEVQPSHHDTDQHTYTHVRYIHDDNNSISLSGFNEGNVDYVARAFADILSRDPLPCSSSSSSTPAVSAGKGEEPTLLIQPQQVLP